MRLDGVGKRYGFRRPWVVREVSLEMPPGALVRVEGKNGTGKSTLLRVIAGVTEPSRGSVAGRPVTGYVPERFPPALPFTARGYLRHLGRIGGLTGRQADERAGECLELLGAGEHADLPLRQASKGTCQKVAIAQALLARPGLLVLDEAWTGLDADARGALDAVVAERLTAGGRVVYVDHEDGRLAGLGPQRWRVEPGLVSAVPGEAGVAHDAEVARGGAERGGGEPGRAPASRAAALRAGARAVRALTRYQLALLLRSHRWIPPAILFALGVAGLGGAGGPDAAHGAALAQGLSWSALMLVPAVAWLTRLLLTAEPPAARACAAAAGGPRRAQVAALAAALLAGAVLGLAGTGWELATSGVVRGAVGNAFEAGATFAVLAHGLVAALICLLVGSVAGTLGNPPLVRQPAVGMLGTASAVVLALAWHVSPANAAVRSTGPATGAAAWLAGGPVPVVEAIALVALVWAVSARVAARHGG